MKTLLSYATAVVLLQSPPTRLYQDPAGRFTFSYPSAFGVPSVGTNNAFGDLVAAVRFATFPARLGGEAVLTKGFPLIDLQSVGGLYDSITLEIFPEPIRSRILAELPRLTAATFCEALGRSRHLDLERPAFGSLTPQQKEAIARTDGMFNTAPRVIACRAAGAIVTFDKERAFDSGYPAQHVYGAVRFLGEPFSTFQLIAGGAPPDRAALAAIADVVASFQPR